MAGLRAIPLLAYIRFYVPRAARDGRLMTPVAEHATNRSPAATVMGRPTAELEDFGVTAGRAGQRVAATSAGWRRRARGDRQMSLWSGSLSATGAGRPSRKPWT